MSDLRTELMNIRAEYGELTPANTVDAARTAPDEYPSVYARLDWNDTTAAESHRRWQARHLIATVVRTVPRRTGEDVSIREFHAIRGVDPEDPDNSAYEPLDVIIQDELMTSILLMTMKRDWQTLKRRYDHFDAFRKMVIADIENDA